MHAQQPTGRSFRHRFEGPFYRRLVLAGLRNLPPALQRASMPLWGGLFWGLVPSARRMTESNLAQVLSSSSSAWRVRRCGLRLFVNYAQSISNLYLLHLEQPLPLEVSFEGRHHVLGVIESGRGVVSITAHLGPWQIMPFVISQNGELPPMTLAMAEEPNAAVSAFEKNFRARFRIVYTTASSFALLELANVLRRGEIVGMQLDRHPGGPHLMLPFCGRLAPFPLGPAMIARITGCPLVPVFAAYTDKWRRKATVYYEEPIEVARTQSRDEDLRLAMTRAVSVYERYVRRFPDQWFNFHDCWAPPPKAQPEAQT